MFLRSLKHFSIGLLVGVGGYMYLRDPKAIKGLSQSDKKIINGYIDKNNLEITDTLLLHKAYQMQTQALYFQGLINKLDGYYFHEIYVSKQEQQAENIRHIYCVFCAKDKLCGHPEIVHGGISATMIDQVLSTLSVYFTKNSTLTKKMAYRYTKPVRSGKIYCLQGQVIDSNEQEVQMKATIKDIQSSEVCVTGQLVFKKVDMNEDYWKKIINKGIQTSQNKASQLS